MNNELPFVQSRDLTAHYLEYRMLTGVPAASKHKLQLVIRIRLVIHETFYPLKNKPALKEMAAAPIEESNKAKIARTLVFHLPHAYRRRI